MGKLLWEPSKERILNANISKFIDYVNNKHGLEISSWHKFNNWGEHTCYTAISPQNWDS